MARKKKEILEPIIEKEEVVLEDKKEEKIEEKVEKVTKNAVKTMEVYNCYRLRVRKEPSLTSDVIEEINAGEKVEVLEDCGDFVKVPNGYMMKAFLK